MVDQKIKKVLNLDLNRSDCKVYTMKGDPTFMGSTRFGNGKIGDICKRNKTRDAITVSSQHNDLPLYKGPLKLVALFYFMAHQRDTVKRKFNRSGDSHTAVPNLLNCAKYIEEVCKGVLFQDSNAVCIVETHKLYDLQPRVDFWIVEL